MKNCARCKQQKQRTEFYTLKNGKLHSYCKPCHWSYQKERLAASDEAAGVKKRQWTRWTETNIGRYRHTQRMANARRMAVLKTILYEVFGDCCVRCGFKDKRALQIDHIHGNAVQDKERFGSLTTTYLRHVIATGRSDYQILCSNCNWIKRHEEGKAATPYAIISDPKRDPFYNKFRSLLLDSKESEEVA